MVRALGFSASILVLAGAATATPSNDPAYSEQNQAIQAAMDAAMAELMRPGPRQDGWDKGGVDIYGLAESAPGGTAANYLLEVDREGERSVVIIHAEDPGRHIPERWKSLLHAGSSKEPAGAHVLTFARIDGPFYLAGWENFRRVGDAFCSLGNIGGELYESADQAIETELPRAMIPAIFLATAKRLEEQPMCWRYDRDGDGFKVTYFLEDGRTLPGLNEYKERVTLVPAGPIDQLLKAAAR